MRGKITISIIIFGLLIFNNNAQTKQVDCDQWQNRVDTIQNINRALHYSKQVLAMVEDECKAKIYLNSAKLLHLGLQKNDSSLYLYDKTIKLSKALQNDQILSEAYTNKALILTQLLKNEEAIVLLENAEKLLKKNLEDKSWAVFFEAQAEIADNNSEYLKAIQYADSMTEVSIITKDTFNLYSSYHNKGIYNFRLSNYEDAIINLLKALDLHELNKDLVGEARTNYLVGYSYLKWGYLETAKRYFEKGVTIAKEKGDHHTLLLTYPYLAECHRKLNENEEALQTINRGITLAEEFNNNERIARAFSEKGWLYLKNFKKYIEAEDYFTTAYNAAKVTNNDVYLQPSLHGLIDAYLEQGEYTEAQKYFNLFEKVTKNLNILYHTQEYHKIYSRYYEKTSRPSLAIKHLKEYYKIKDSISNLQVKTQLTNLEKKYDTKRKEITILNLKRQKEQQEKLTEEASLRQNLFLGASISLAIILTLVGGLFFKLKKQKKQLDEAHKNVTEINQVKNRLFSIIAHDLRGMILPFQRSGKILKHYIEKENHDKTIELSEAIEKNSERLSQTLDNLLNWSLEQMNGYNMKTETISVYHELKEITLGYQEQADYKKTKIEIKYTEDLCIDFDKGAFHVIFRNLIGNALKYTEEGCITIHFKEEHKNLVCSLTDTGIGMNANQLQTIFSLDKQQTTVGTKGEKGTGLGLNLVYRFIKMQKGEIVVSSELGIGTRFDIKIPITKLLKGGTNKNLKPMSA
ncbi:tetratricopeptide repeat-containing sensor histidine kinase [Aquimarina algicola]|uniref:histidine kinase n=1 Tax=Aquimarina algicola TaxID=2589995 RepID=A0A504JNU3_9FLAO|nr:ATP-binding protein [Aquimarina algicola]TPN88040.1 hypothetical protein FHK87_10745 [Aquimarina algicola]